MTSPALHPTELWKSEAWNSQVQSWILQVLATFGIEQTGPVSEPRIRFWSVQLTIPTDHGKLWFKENNPGQFQEASIIAALAFVKAGADLVTEPLLPSAVLAEIALALVLLAHAGAVCGVALQGAKISPVTP